MGALLGRGGEAPATEMGWQMSRAISGQVPRSCVRTSGLFSWLSPASPRTPGLAGGLHTVGRTGAESELWGCGGLWKWAPGAGADVL